MPKLKVIYNKEFDVQRIINTIKKIDWYTENGYNKNIVFPVILDREKIKKYSEEEIKNAVEKECSENTYNENEKFLIDNWETISKELESAFSKSNLLLQNEYIIYLTKYGTGGSYDLPNTVIINLNNSSKASMLKTIIHEIIHLGIQKYVDEYGIDHWQKERIVDLFFIKNFPKRAILQNVYSSIDTEKLDQTFDDNFPNMKAVIEKIK